MKYCILMGSPRKNGNTAAILTPFSKELSVLGNECTITSLYEKHIEACTACRHCQNEWTVFGCIQQDEVHEIFDMILECDVIVLATPIYSWYCTPPMKALLDRLVYGMNKFYGDERGPSLWAGKYLALLTTCGYPPEKGADLWEEGMKRYCKHSNLQYSGNFVERDLGYKTVFMSEEKELRAREYAQKLHKTVKEYGAKNTGEIL